MCDALHSKQLGRKKTRTHETLPPSARLSYCTEYTNFLCVSLHYALNSFYAM